MNNTNTTCQNRRKNELNAIARRLGFTANAKHQGTIPNDMGTLLTALKHATEGKQFTTVIIHDGKIEVQ